MNSFEEIDYYDVDSDDHLRQDGGPPFDEIIRAYWHFIRVLRYWPRPRLEYTRWEVNTYEGPEVQTDEGPDGTTISELVIELRDFNDEVLAVYTITDNVRLRLRIVNKKNKNLRESRPGKNLPGKRVR